MTKSKTSDLLRLSDIDLLKVLVENRLSRLTSKNPLQPRLQAILEKLDSDQPLTKTNNDPLDIDNVAFKNVHELLYAVNLGKVKVNGSFFPNVIDACKVEAHEVGIIDPSPQLIATLLSKMAFQKDTVEVYSAGLQTISNAIVRQLMTDAVCSLGLTVLASICTNLNSETPASDTGKESVSETEPI